MGQRKVETMSRFLLVPAAVVLGALGFAAGSQAGITLPGRGEPVPVRASSLEGRYVVPGCRVKATLKYDFYGNPYLRKVRICA
jgi:hypothetical protein